MSQTSRDRNNSRRVRTHEKNSGETVPRLGTIIQSIFCAQSGAGIRLNFGNSSVRVDTQGLFRPYLKTSVPPFLPTRLTAPGISPRRRNPEEALISNSRVSRKVLTVEIYSQYGRKNLDLLEQRPRGIGR